MFCQPLFAVVSLSLFPKRLQVIIASFVLGILLGTHFIIHAIFRHASPRSAYRLITSTMQTVCISWSTSIQRTIWLALWWKGGRQGRLHLYKTGNLCVSIRSHPHQVRKEWKRIGRISGTLECSAQWLSPPWCYIINLIQGMLSLVLLAKNRALKFNVIPVYNLGHSRKLKNEWKPVARNINMNPNHHHPHHDQYILDSIFYEICL